MEIRIQQLESEISFYKQQLELSSKLSALGEMAAGIGHEINNPLAIIASRAGAMIELSRSGHLSQLEVQQIHESALSVERTVFRISQIVKSLRSFARGLVSENFELVQFEVIVRDALEIAKPRTKKCQIETEFTVNGEPLPVLCSPSQMTQVIVNLLGNSCDAIESLDERWIKINLDYADAKRAIPHQEAPTQFLTLRLTDSGPTPEPSIQSKMMEPFFTTKAPGRGTGLGLSICKKIVDQHKGELFLNPEAFNTQLICRIPIESAQVVTLSKIRN
jgi:C4-dicarboxylate-specific signal transduction histidine kinase